MAVVLTFAELAFLLPDEASNARKRLHLVEWDAESSVPLAGAASLAARGLVHRDAPDSMVPVGELLSVIETIANARTWVQIGFARETTIGGLQIYDDSGKRLEATAQPLGSFAFAIGDAATPLGNAVGALVRSFLAALEPGAVFIKTAGSTEEQDGLAIRRTERGTFEVALGDVDAAAISETALDAAVGTVERYVATTATAEV